MGGRGKIVGKDFEMGKVSGGEGKGERWSGSESGSEGAVVGVREVEDVWVGEWEGMGVGEGGGKGKEGKGKGWRSWWGR